MGMRTSFSTTSRASRGWDSRCFSGAMRALLEVDVVFLQDAGPAPDLGVEEGLEVLRRLRQRYRQRRVGERVLHRLALHRLDRRRVEPVDDRARRLRLEEEAVPVLAADPRVA